MNVAPGRPSAATCLYSSSGTAIRHCDEHKGWLPPNLFNCTSITFSKLKVLVCGLSPTLLSLKITLGFRINPGNPIMMADVVEEMLKC